MCNVPSLRDIFGTPKPATRKQKHIHLALLWRHTYSASPPFASTLEIRYGVPFCSYHTHNHDRPKQTTTITSAVTCPRCIALDVFRALDADRIGLSDAIPIGQP